MGECAVQWAAASNYTRRGRLQWGWTRSACAWVILSCCPQWSAAHILLVAASPPSCVWTVCCSTFQPDCRHPGRLARSPVRPACAASPLTQPCHALHLPCSGGLGGQGPAPQAHLDARPRPLGAAPALPLTPHGAALSGVQEWCRGCALQPCFCCVLQPCQCCWAQATTLQAWCAAPWRTPQLWDRPAAQAQRAHALSAYRTDAYLIAMPCRWSCGRRSGSRGAAPASCRS